MCSIVACLRSSWVERPSPKRLVVGSTPTGGTFVLKCSHEQRRQEEVHPPRCVSRVGFRGHPDDRTRRYLTGTYWSGLQASHPRSDRGPRRFESCLQCNVGPSQGWSRLPQKSWPSIRQGVSGKGPTDPFMRQAVFPAGVTGNTSDSGSEESWFEPRVGSKAGGIPLREGAWAECSRKNGGWLSARTPHKPSRLLRSSNGRTRAFGTRYVGSNPARSAVGAESVPRSQCGEFRRCSHK